MYCPQCGTANEDTARSCAKCGMDLDDFRQQWGQSSVPPAGEQQPPQQNPGYDQYRQPSYPPPPPPPPYYQPAPAYGAMPHVPSYIGWAIVTLILCFWPTGIAAVVYASQVGSKLAAGDYAGALASSRKAKMWCWISFGIAIAGIVIGILVAVLAAASFNPYMSGMPVAFR